MERKLRENTAQLGVVLSFGALATWRWDLDRNRITPSAELIEILGLEHEGEPMGPDDLLACVHPEDRQRVERHLEAARQGSSPIDIEHRIRFPAGQESGEVRWIQSRGQPVGDEGAKADTIVGATLDVTVRRQADAEHARTATDFHTLADNIHQLAWMADSTGWIYWYNRRWFDYTGTTLADMAGWGWRSVHHPDHIDRVVAKISACFESGEPWEDTFPLRGKDDAYRWFLSRALPIHDEDGKVIRWFGTNTDITERRQAEEQRILLINELNHRVKNTLATIQAIASQTLRGSAVADGVKSAFEARLMALSDAHTLLTKSNWEGADLHKVVARALQPHADPSRFVAEGPAVFLPPKRALAIAMGLHELATNAVKYGALSTDTGQIAVTWELKSGDPRQIVLHWREEGGPRVAPPRHRGFGSRLIERGLATDLNGSARIDYAPEGVRCTIVAAVEMPAPKLQ